MANFTQPDALSPLENYCCFFVVIVVVVVVGGGGLLMYIFIFPPLGLQSRTSLYSFSTIHLDLRKSICSFCVANCSENLPPPTPLVFYQFVLLFFSLASAL